MDGQNKRLTLDAALTDMRLFQRGDAGTTRHYRDRVGMAGTLMTASRVITMMPLLLGVGLFAEVHFGHLGTSRRDDAG
jgi:hypothetical protein